MSKLNIIIPKICEQSGKYRSGGSSYIHFLRVKNIRFPFLSSICIAVWKMSILVLSCHQFISGLFILIVGSTRNEFSKNRLITVRLRI